MGMIECILCGCLAGLAIAFLIWFARVPKTLDGPSKVKPKPYFIVGGILGVIFGIVIYNTAFKPYEPYLNKNNSGSTMTAAQEKQANEAGYVKKADGKWYYVGDSPNNDKNKIKVTIENK